MTPIAANRPGRWRYVVGAALALLVAGPTGRVEAKTLQVPEQHPTIQEALRSAEDLDEIDVAPGTYALAAPLDYQGKAVRVRSRSGPAETTLRRTYPDPESGSVAVFRSGETAASVLEGFTLTGGTGSAVGGSPCGGAILCLDGSSPLLRNLIVVRNRATYGGALFCRGSSPTLEDCTLSENSVKCGGGAYLEASSPRFTRCTIRGNRGYYASSGVHSKAGSRPVLDRCRIVGNATYYGGGIDSFQSLPTLTNCIVAGNRATEGGGAYVAGDSGIRMTNCTVAFNQSPSGMDLRLVGTDVRFASCILTRLDTRPGEPLDAARFESCLLSTDPGFAAAGVFDFTRMRTADMQGPTELPDFVVSEPDFRLLPDSPAVDRGTPEGAPPIDIDGVPRPQGAGVDVGAHELEAPTGEPSFLRGDAGASGGLDISDPILVLLHLVGQASVGIPCEKAADANDDGAVNILDPVLVLRALFLSEPLGAGPLACGIDGTPDQIPCGEFPACS